MSRAFGYDKLAEDMAALFEAQIRQACAEQEGRHKVELDSWRVESPMEWLLFYSVMQYCTYFSEQHYVGSLGVYKTENDIDWCHDLAVITQAQVGSFRLDFMFLVQDEKGKLHKLAVECDGHDFHERTKEQAAKDRSRDRALQAMDFVVMRFTGREIYLDPLKCVREIMNWASRKRLIGFSVNLGGTPE